MIKHPRAAGPRATAGQPEPPLECEHLSAIADQLARLHPVPEPEPTPPPAVHAEGLLRRLESSFLWLDRLVERALPPTLNPFGQLGAVANICLIIAVVSGIVLLLWYTPSVHQAYDSIERLRAGSFLGQWIRSLHRYSSDGCLFFILLHALRIVFQRRFAGPRWLAWSTGLLMLVALWFIGWTGYWLVWDVRGQHAALGTAQFLDQLPIFAEPMSRSFLTDASVPSLLFFLIFFIHMLSPLALGIGLWMHLMRVNRARFLTNRAMTLWIIGSLALLSVLLPATSAAPAQMTAKATPFTIDWWYLWPLALTDRLSGGMLWAVFLGAGLVMFTVPWWLVKRRRTPEWQAQVEVARCFGCTHCSLDCPFNAITMVAREDGKPFAVQAAVNPELCVGCGICTGSCDSQAINLPALNSRVIEKQLNGWLDEQTARGVRPFVAFCCAESIGASLRGDRTGQLPDLPGYRIESVPCTGWVSAVLLERLLKRGAAGVLVVACGESDPVAREGGKWFGHRLAGARDPGFDPKKADPNRVRFVQVSRTDRAGLVRAAREFQQAGVSPAIGKPAPSRVRQLVAAAALAVVLGGVTFAFSNLPYRTAHSPAPELIVSFSHGGAVREPRKLTKEELDRRLPHMRAQVNVTRERVPVRLRVRIDGEIVSDDRYQPKGFSKDGPSIAVVRLRMVPGAHRVQVELADTADAEAWTRSWDETVAFETNRVRVILFDTKAGFTLQ